MNRILQNRKNSQKFLMLSNELLCSDEKYPFILKGHINFGKWRKGMKQILLAVMMVFMFQSVVFADNETDEGEGEKFEPRKAKILENIGKRRVLLNELESCVGSANSGEEMKSCKQKHQQGLNALHPKRKEMKEKHMKRKDMKRKRDRDKDE